MLQVSQLYIYPVKSLGGISIGSAAVTERGLEHDRRWMLVNADNRFLTQREFPLMSMLQPAFDGNGFRIYKKQEPGSYCWMEFSPVKGERIQVNIWGNTCEALAPDPVADQWFSEALGTVCRLVYMTEDTFVEIDPKYTGQKMLTSFSDGFPILIAGEESLADLNDRMDTPVPMDRFRPNIVCKGGMPFEEDGLLAFSINGVSFSGVKPSERCVITTIDQDTARKSREPLYTLSTFRKRHTKTYFGQNVIAHSTGTIHTGDGIIVATTQEPIF